MGQFEYFVHKHHAFVCVTHDNNSIFSRNIETFPKTLKDPWKKKIQRASHWEMKDLKLVSSSYSQFLFYFGRHVHDFTQQNIWWLLNFNVSFVTENEKKKFKLTTVEFSSIGDEHRKGSWTVAMDSRYSKYLIASILTNF